MTRPLLTALLYASLALGANPVLAGDLPAEIEALREGAMRKLVVHDTPVPVSGVYQTEDGSDVQLGASNGKVRIVNFWATWCAPCREEKPALDALNKELSGSDFEVIAIATGRNSDASIKKFNAENGIESLSTHLDPKGQLAREMGVLGLPVSIVLDRQGREVARLTGGADWNSESARAIIARLIAEPGA